MNPTEKMWPRVDTQEVKKQSLSPEQVQEQNKNQIDKKTPKLAKQLSNSDIDLSKYSKNLKKLKEEWKETWKELLKILHWKESSEVAEKSWRREVLKVLDTEILKTLPEWQDIDSIATILKKPDGSSFESKEEAKDFLREQFLKWKLKDLDTPLLDEDGNVLKDKNWNEITNYTKALEENPILWDIEKNNPELSKEILAIYWKDVLDSYWDILNWLKQDWKLPNNLDEFNNMLKEYAVKDSSNPEDLKKTIDSMLENWVISSSEAQSMARWISQAEARNIQAEALPDLESLQWEEKTLALIKHFEWFSPNAFWDYKQWTHWYWTKADWPNDSISKMEATQELKNKVNSEYNLKNELTKRWIWDVYEKMWDNQKAALTSFIFNLWPWKLSNFVNLLKNYPQTALKIADKMERYNKAWWKILKWLVSRRKTESKLFLTKNNDDLASRNKTESKVDT